LEYFRIREIRYHWPEFNSIEKDETQESGRKTPISLEIIDVENDKLVGKSVVIGIIR
jgi:hypothetical protein